MKTIGYILGQFPVLSQTFVGNELRAMQERGHKIVPIVLKRTIGPANPQDLLTAVHSTFLENVPSQRAVDEFKRPGIGAVRSMSYLLNQQSLPRYSLLGNALKIVAIARQHGCDHLHAHFAGGAASHAIVAARWMGATVSFTSHGTDVNRDREDLELKLQKADLSIGVCNDMVEEFAMIGPASQLAMVPCGTSTEQFRPAETLKTNGRLLYLGRLSASKGVEDLIEAAYRLGDHCADIDIVGDGPLAHPLKKRAKDYGLLDTKIRFLGAKSPDWIAREAPFYQGAVLPFKQAADGQKDTGPLVVKEAMAMGLPVLSTRFMGIKDTISEGTGLLVEPGNIRQLSEAMKQLSVLNEIERIELGKRARNRIQQHFTIESQARTLSGLIETLGTVHAEEDYVKNDEDHVVQKDDVPRRAYKNA
ncbi:MAG: glycosyltransferase [Hyphomicrobiales bacterium]